MKRRKKQRRRMNPNTVLVIRQVLIGVMIFSFIGLLVLSIWYGTRVKALTLDTVEVEGGETISHEQVSDIAWSNLDGSYLGLVPKVFSPTFPKEKIVEDLSEVDRIKNIQVVSSDNNTLSVTFDEYTPEALWCKAEEIEACVFLDENGFAFSKAPRLSGGAFMRYVLVGEDPEVDKQIIETETYDTLEKLTLLLADSGWFISRVDIDAARDAYLQIIGGGELKVSLKQSPTETVNNLLTVLSADEFSDIAPGNFKYIDLRFGEKVFVNEVLESVEEELEEETEVVIETPTLEELEQEDSVQVISSATASSSLEE